MQEFETEISNKLYKLTIFIISAFNKPVIMWLYPALIQ